MTAGQLRHHTTAGLSTCPVYVRLRDGTEVPVACVDYLTEKRPVPDTFDPLTGEAVVRLVSERIVIVAGDAG